jgi:hypothetical protein
VATFSDHWRRLALAALDLTDTEAPGLFDDNP